MYNSFPDSAESIYLSDSAGTRLAIKKYFSYDADAITHNYHNINDNLKAGTSLKTTNSLLTGELMWRQISPHAYKSTNVHGIEIHHLIYFLRNDSILQNDSVLYRVP